MEPARELETARRREEMRRRFISPLCERRESRLTRTELSRGTTITLTLSQHNNVNTARIYKEERRKIFIFNSKKLCEYLLSGYFEIEG